MNALHRHSVGLHWRPPDLGFLHTVREQGSAVSHHGFHRCGGVCVEDATKHGIRERATIAPKIMNATHMPFSSPANTLHLLKP